MIDQNSTLEEAFRAFLKEIVREVLAELHSSSPEEWLGVKEAAQRLHVEPRWIYEKTHKKAIPFRRVGKFLQFKTSDLDKIGLKQ